MKIQRLIAGEEGSSLVEFGVSSSLLFAAIFGVMDCSRAIYANHYCAQSARAATRYAMVRGNTYGGTSCATTASQDCLATSANVVSYVKSLAPTGITPSNVTVVASWPGTTPAGSACTNSNAVTTPGCIVQVTVDYSFNFVLPFLPKNTLMLSSSSAVTITQ